MTQLTFASAEPIRTVTATEQVFDALYGAIISLDLPPGMKVSEAEIAGRLGVSRQPVRDAFYRLSQLGFLMIRPQRSTTITKISEPAVLQAKFIRTALELACLRAAMDRMTEAELAELEAMLDEQEEAVVAGRRLVFHDLDDAFHRRLCEIAGHGYAWSLIREHKAHMDRVRYLSLAFGAQSAFDDHRALLAAIRAGDRAGAETRLTEHLGRIEFIMGQIRAENAPYFEDPADEARPALPLSAR